MKELFYYQDPTKYSYNKLINVNSRKETLIYEGTKYELLKNYDTIIDIREYNIISNENFNDIPDVKRLKAILDEFNPSPDKFLHPFSTIEYDIFMESMISAGNAEMDIYLDNTIYKLKFIIARSVEYDSNSTKIGEMDKHLYFVVETQNVTLDNIENNTITYIKTYTYKTLK